PPDAGHYHSGRARGLRRHRGQAVPRTRRREFPERENPQPPVDRAGAGDGAGGRRSAEIQRREDRHGEGSARIRAGEIVRRVGVALCVIGRSRMGRLAGFVFFISVLLTPTVVVAQASIVGAVKDTSGAVLPGVTVEAMSPALIEKVRSAVTDGTGRYRIENLQPGTYTVSF